MAAPRTRTLDPARIGGRPRKVSPGGNVNPATLPDPPVVPVESPPAASPADAAADLAQMFKTLGPAPDVVPVDEDAFIPGRGQQKGVYASRAVRRVEALSLRLAGHDYRVIAEEMGIPLGTAYRDVQEALTYLVKHERVMAEQVRGLELSRLDALQVAVWHDAEGGDVDAVNCTLRIMERRAKMLGLDEPAKVDLSLDGRPLRDLSSDELRTRLARLRTRYLPAHASTPADVEVEAEPVEDDDA